MEDWHVNNGFNRRSCYCHYRRHLEILLSSVLLTTAFEGKLQQLKKVASEIDGILGVGLPEILGNTKDRDGRRAIHLAAAKGRVNVLKYLVEEIKLDVDVQDKSGETPLCRATVEGRASAVEYLLRMGANPEISTYDNMHPLHLAAQKGYKDVITLLLSKCINIDVSNNFGSPLQFACAYGQHDTVELLLHQKANPNLLLNEAITSLHASIPSKSWQCVEHLLKAGADPNGGPDGVKALSVAAELGVTQIIKLLVEAGADPNVTEIHGLKPIESAAFQGNREAVEILFPVTSPIPSYADWSVDGVMKHADSIDFTIMMVSKKEEVFLEAKSRGTSAFRRKEYRLAVYWYSQALGMYPSDAAVLSNRSLCYVYLNNGKDALSDATQCLSASPDWSKAHYRKGVALKLLNRLDDAADAFFNGLKVDPENKELEAAFREVCLARLKSVTGDKSAD